MANKMLSYPIDIIEDTDGTFLVTAPDLPEVTSFGEDREDAQARALDAVEEAFASRMARQEPIPAPSAGMPRVPIGTQTALKVLLYQHMQHLGVSKTDLARRLHVHRPQIDRLLDLNHASRLDSLDAAFAALGCAVEVRVRPPEAA